MTKTCNFSFYITESSTFKLEGMPTINTHICLKLDPILLRSDKNQFFKTPIYYIQFNSEFNVDETLQNNN